MASMCPGSKSEPNRLNLSLSTRDILQRRAQVYAEIRAFFGERVVLEVETPILNLSSTPDPQIESLVCRDPTSSHGSLGFLHTSPEFGMKRLLAAGAGSIYQICKVFRAEEHGRWHRTEFSLLEWYRVGMDYQELMAEMETLIIHLCPQKATAPFLRLTYRQLFETYLGVNPHLVEVQSLQRLLVAHQIATHTEILDRDPLLHILLSHVIEPQLRGVPFLFVYDFPVSQAALARLRGGAEPIAERFELYASGIELANGFQELTDPEEQRQRFVNDNVVRRMQGKAEIPLDEEFLSALTLGLPECAGVALGLDRLLACLAGNTDLHAVLPLEVRLPV